MKLFRSDDNEREGMPNTPLTKPKKRMKIIVSVVVVLLALVATGCAVWFTQVKAPSVAQKPKNPIVTDTDKEVDEDDAPDIDLGDRVSDYFTFVVGAVDEDETRTDALMVCSFDVKNQKVNVLNVPRDTMCRTTRIGANKKINAAYGSKKGIEQTKTEIQKVIGFKPDYYIVLNFKGIADIVDAIGGVDYEIPFRMYYMDPSQNLSIDFKPGMRHMNGEEVVEFLRWRKNNGGVKTGDKNYTGGDENRIEKQQEFLKYLATQVLDVKNTTKIPNIAKAVFDNVKTDFTWGNMLWMAQKAVGLPSENIKMHTLPGYDAYSYSGDPNDPLSFFFPRESEVLELVNDYFNPYVNRLTDLDIASGPNRSNPNPKPSPSKNTNSSKNDDDDDDDKPTNKAPSQSESKDPETGDTPNDGSTTQPPADDTETPPEGNGEPDAPADDGTSTPENGGTENGGTTTPPENSGTENGGTTTPPGNSGAENGGTTTPPPPENSGAGNAATPSPPPITTDPEA